MKINVKTYYFNIALIICGLAVFFNGCISVRHAKFPESHKLVGETLQGNSTCINLSGRYQNKNYFFKGMHYHADEAYQAIYSLSYFIFPGSHASNEGEIEISMVNNNEFKIALSLNNEIIESVNYSYEDGDFKCSDNKIIFDESRPPHPRDLGIAYSKRKLEFSKTVNSDLALRHAFKITGLLGLIPAHFNQSEVLVFKKLE